MSSVCPHGNYEGDDEGCGKCAREDIARRAQVERERDAANAQVAELRVELDNCRQTLEAVYRERDTYKADRDALASICEFLKGEAERHLMARIEAAKLTSATPGNTPERP